MTKGGRQLPKNHNETTRIPLTVSVQTIGHLEQLVCIGNYGNNVTDAATYVFRRGMDELLRAGIVEIPRMKRP
ncbi:MAG: hypothetical protein FD144_2605 [Rhodospirillaceae bacterium]|nr:MAG: hypothetical protein FD144_2605 [Rhodospirillaceae bacterium]